jgi:hypothetical protein
VNFFDETTLRLKQQLKVTEDKQVAQALGLTGNAWTMRKRRGSFPEKELYALAAKRPELGLDVDLVLTGISSSARGLLDAAQARLERAGDAGLDAAEMSALAAAQAHGPTPARLVQLGGMLGKLRATEFEAVFEMVQSIVSLRETLEKAVGNTPAAGQTKRRKNAA